MRRAIVTCALLTLPACKRDASPTPAAPPAPAAKGASAPAPAPASAVATSATAARHQRHPGTAAQLLALEEGGKAAAAGDLAQAVARYRSALDGPPSGAAISAGLAAAGLLEVDQPLEAQALYLRTLDIADDVPEAHFAAGRFFGGRQDAVRAIRHLKRTVALEPDFLPAYPLLGGLLVSTGREAEAAERMTTYEKRLNRLLRHLRQGERSAPERTGIIELLSYIDDERATAAVISRLEDSDPAVRMAAGGALVDLAGPAAVTALAKAAVREEVPVVRQMLTSALRQARARLADQP